MKQINRARKHSSSLLKDLLAEITPAEKDRTQTKMVVAARLEDFIKANRWSQNDFAGKVCKAPSEITKWLSGTHNFTIDTLTDIAGVINIPVCELLAPKQVEIINRVQYKVVVKHVLQPIPYSTPYEVPYDLPKVGNSSGYRSGLLG